MMKTRILSGLLAVMLLFGMAPKARAAAVYTDVPEKHWAAADIRNVTEAGLFQGVSENVFGLRQSMTRAQFVTALVRLFGWTPVNPATPTFTDCEKNRWFYSAVETACANGALPAYEKQFRPSDAITREEMTTMLVRALGYAAQAGQVAATLPFSDVKTNRGYIAVAYDMGLITGYDDGKFHPEQVATREQAAAVMSRLYTRMTAEPLQVTEEDGYILLEIPAPKATTATALPTTPLESFDDLYEALKAQRRAGADMSKVAVVLTAGGIATTVHGSMITDSKPVTAEEVTEYLAKSGVRTYYSEKHQCPYMLVPTVGSGRITVWYQNEKSVAEKLELCRLFGVTAYVLRES